MLIVYLNVRESKTIAEINTTIRTDFCMSNGASTRVRAVKVAYSFLIGVSKHSRLFTEQDFWRLTRTLQVVQFLSQNGHRCT